MKKYTAAVLVLSALTAFSAVSCGGKKIESHEELIGLEWYETYEKTVSQMENYSLKDERNSETGDISQKMLDYSGIELFETDFELTLCFAGDKLIGLNYHDTEKSKNYREWYDFLEQRYGVPTEKGNGTSAWYDNPLGDNSYVYLFNLADEVQISYYVSAVSPDQDHKVDRKRANTVPTPEIRTPVIPYQPEVRRETVTTSVAEDESAVTTTVYSQDNWDYEDYGENIDETDGETVTQDADAAVSGKHTTTAKSEKQTTTTKTGKNVTTTVRTTSATTSTTAVTTQKINDEYRINGLRFYGSPKNECAKMSAYVRTYDSYDEETGEYWAEYMDVDYHGRSCDVVLYFNKLGLVAINYFDNTNHLTDWTEIVTAEYGEPDVSAYNYRVWNSGPIGEGTMIYVTALEDGIQISFFADDTQ